MSDYLLIAKVISSHGRNGTVKIVSSFDFKEIFSKLEKIFMDFFGDKKLLKVENIEEGNDCFFLKIKNFDSESDSEILIGKNIFVDKNDLLELPEDHFFVPPGSSYSISNFSIEQEAKINFIIIKKDEPVIEESNKTPINKNSEIR